ncbi:MAG: GspE/PulE family protein, partial [Candidatus Paceibacterota bacterium]
MPQFNDAEEDKKIEDLHEAEEERLAQMLADKYGVKYVNLIGVPIDPGALKLIPEDVAREREVAAFEKVGTHIFLATRSPGRDLTEKTVKELEHEGFEVTLYITSKASLEKAWTRYEDISFAEKSKEGLLDVSNKSIEEFSQSASSRESVKKLVEEVVEMKKKNRTTRIVEVILAGAIGLKASDVHIEPEEDSVGVRMRIDGILVPITDITKETYNLLLSRIKLLSGIKLNVNTTAQDGRFTIEIGDRTLEIRSSTLPGAYGESIVMRLLDPETIAVELETLGMRPKLLEFVKKELSKPNGMILNTGPTGSGKTTTLYAFLKQIYQEGTKVITIEDPIEYHIDGITQTQVEPEKDYTFLSGLTSALRQDPDIIMVGEIRDEETAKTAIHAALTGHLVFSTLHTNTAVGTFARLIDLGVSPDIIGSSINFTMAQRLVRTL